MMTGVAAVRIGIVMFVIPFVFAFYPDILLIEAAFIDPTVTGTKTYLPGYDGTVDLGALGVLILRLLLALVLLASALARYDRAPLAQVRPVRRLRHGGVVGARDDRHVHEPHVGVRAAHLGRRGVLADAERARLPAHRDNVLVLLHHERHEVPVARELAQVRVTVSLALAEELVEVGVDDYRRVVERRVVDVNAVERRVVDVDAVEGRVILHAVRQKRRPRLDGPRSAECPTRSIAVFAVVFAPWPAGKSENGRHHVGNQN